MRKQAMTETQRLWQAWTSSDPNDRPLQWTSRIYKGMDAYLKVPLTAGPEDSVGIVGPPRVGKTSGLLIPQILLWLGPLIVASTKDDVLQATGDRRAWLAARRGGYTMVYSPTEASDTTGMLRAHWSPLTGCEDPTTCSIRANTMLASAAKGVEDADFWRTQAASVLTAYFHAAAVAKGYNMSDVMEWLTTGEVDTPAELLAEHASPDASRWAQSLIATKRTSDRERASIWAVAKTGLAVFDSAVVLDNSAETDWFVAPSAFLTGCSTLYIVAPSEQQAATAPLIAALIESMVAGAIGMARLSGGRLEPPLLLLLDEVANIAPLPSLPSILSQGGSQGVLVSWAAQSLSQLRARWGQDIADTIWASSRTKAVFGGLSDQRDLETISRFAGEVMVDVGNGLTQPRPRLPVDYLANLTAGYAVVSGVGKPPNPLEIPAVYNVPLFAAELGWHPPAKPSERRWGPGLVTTDELDATQVVAASGTGGLIPDASLSKSPSLIVSSAGEPDGVVRSSSITLGTFVSPEGAIRHVRSGSGTSTLRITSEDKVTRSILGALREWGEHPAIVLTSEAGLVDRIGDSFSGQRAVSLYRPAQPPDSLGQLCGWNPISVDYWNQWHAIEQLAEMNMLFAGCLWAAAVANRALEDIDAWMEMDQFTPALSAVRSYVAQHPERDTPFFQIFASLVEGPPSNRADQRSAARGVLTWLAPQVRAESDAGIPFLAPDEWAHAGGVLIGLISDRHSDQCVRSLANICSRAAQEAGHQALVIHDRLKEDGSLFSAPTAMSKPCRLVIEDALDPTRTPWGGATHQLIDLPITDRRVLARVENDLSEFAPQPQGDAANILFLSRALPRPCLLNEADWL